jgi:UDP:flavonoid glycosyltransferase YjiC (YdhE family)
MRDAVERLLHEPAFRQNAQRLARSFVRCGGASRAAELIAALVPENQQTG